MSVDPRTVKTGDPALGKRIGNLTLVSRLGRGGSGTVYRAEHRSLKASYAVKLLHGGFTNDPRQVERFRREAVALSRLRHPNIVFITDFGRHPKLGLYLAMEFLQGRSLKAVVGDTGLPLASVERIAGQIADAMAAAHERGIIHRDLKLENVQIVDGAAEVAKVVDFGIVRMADRGGEGDDAAELTQAGIALGTPLFMAPEQILGRADLYGPHTDVYAFGVMIYAMVTGRKPFENENPYKVMDMHLKQEPPPLSVHRGDLAGSALEGLVAKMLLKRPDERIRTMSEVKRELVSAMAELRSRGLLPPLTGAQQEAALTSVPATTEEPSEREQEPGAPRLGLLMEQLADPSGRSLCMLPRMLDAVADRLGDVPDDLLAHSLWSWLCTDLIQSTGLPHAQESQDRLVIWVEELLDASERADAMRRGLGDGAPASHLAGEMLEAAQTFLAALDDAVEKPLTRALRPLAGHPAMPPALIDEHSGTWEALDEGGSGEYAVVRATGELPEDDGLLDKLKRDVSMENIRSLLSHSFQFGRKKE